MAGLAAASSWRGEAPAAGARTGPRPTGRRRPRPFSTAAHLPAVLHNSLRTRSPLFRGFPGPAIISHNNALTFVGTEGAVFCRQYPITESSCADRDFWTKDRQALVADCFGLTDAAGQALPHRMSSNAYSHELGSKLASVDRQALAAEIAARYEAHAASGNRIGPEVGDLTLLDIPVEAVDVVVTSRLVAGKSLGELAQATFARAVFLSRLTRSGFALPISPES